MANPACSPLLETLPHLSLSLLWCEYDLCLATSKAQVLGTCGGGGMSELGDWGRFLLPLEKTVGPQFVLPGS